jgi:phage shock protein E
MESLKEILASSKANLVDVRTPEEFASGSVAGSINIPMSEVESNLDKLKSLQPLVVFCRSGARSGNVLGYLQHNGLEHVWNGGGWKDLNHLISEL